MLLSTPVLLPFLLRVARPGFLSRPRSRARIVGWIGVGLALVSLAACGGKSETSSNAAASSAGNTTAAAASAADPAATNESLRVIVTARKACELLTRPDAEAAVWQPLPQNTVNVTLGKCDDNSADFSAGASLTVGSWESIRNAALGGVHKADVTGGVGDEALEKGGLLYVRKGNEGFLLTLHGPKIDHLADRGLAQEKDLAGKIVSRF
ncbi:MAG: hypothetical protein ABJC61_10585 [Acidobacteriota bacterium]